MIDDHSLEKDVAERAKEGDNELIKQRIEELRKATQKLGTEISREDVDFGIDRTWFRREQRT